MSMQEKIVYAHGTQSYHLSFLPNAAKTSLTKAPGASWNDIFLLTSSLFSNIKLIAASFKRAQFSQFLSRQIGEDKRKYAKSCCFDKTSFRRQFQINDSISISGIKDILGMGLHINIRDLP
jgi:hypothetical protein